MTKEKEKDAENDRLYKANIKQTNRRNGGVIQAGQLQVLHARVALIDCICLKTSS